MAMTDFSSLQKAIQDAFDTYWRVREGREQRGENEKTRQMQMQMSMMGERGATDRARMGITSAEKIAGGELGLGREKLGLEKEKLAEDIRSNKAKEDILWSEIAAKIKAGKTAEAAQMMIAAATETNNLIESAQAAFRNGNFDELLAMAEFNDKDIESLKKLQPQYALPIIAEKIQKYSINKWKPVYEFNGEKLFDYPSYLKSLYNAQVPKVSAEASPAQIQQGMSPMWGPSPTAEQKSIMPRYREGLKPGINWQDFLNRFKKK